MLKKILYVVLGLIALVLVVAAFTSKEMGTESSIVINKPKSVVFDYLVQLKNQDNFSIWNMKDPNMKKEYSGIDGTVGFIYSWESENNDVGEGAQEIKAIVPGERIDMELRFEEPMEMSSQAYFTTTSVNDSTTSVTWGFKGSAPYPLNIMCLFMDKTMDGAFDKGLNNLKGILERPTM